MKVLFHCMDSCGHIAAATGLAEALAARGHQVTFLVSELHRGRFARLGFGEVLLSMKKNKSEEDENSVSAAQPCFKQTAEQLARNGLLSGVSPLEKLRRHNVGEGNFLDTLCEKLAAFDGQMEAAIERLQPDLLLCNQFLTPPAILRAGLPWIFQVSFGGVQLFFGVLRAIRSPPVFFQYPCNPLALYHSKANVDKLPPFYSGFPVASDPSTWREYRHFLDTEYVQRYKRYQDRLNALCGYEPPPAQPTQESSPPPPLAENVDHFAKSPYLNVFDFPTELAYDEIAPTPDNCLQFEAFFRGPGSQASSERFHLPEGFLGSNEKLIYLSMGSYGGIDVQLMRRLVAVLARTPHKYIVSKGLRAEEYDLPGNCWGEAFLPQTAILPLVDLVITHGGK